MNRSAGIVIACLAAALIGCGPQNPPTTVKPKSSPEPEPVARPGTPIPAGGEPVLATDEEQRQLNRGPDGAFAEFERVSDAAMGFTNVLRCRVTGELPEKAWYTQVSTPTALDLKAGDTVLISFWARAVASQANDGQGDFLVFFGVPAAEDTPPEERIKETLMERRKVDRQWRQFLIPRRVAADYPAGQARMNLDFGYAVQTLEFARIQVFRYPGKEPDTLPSTE